MNFVRTTLLSALLCACASGPTPTTAGTPDPEHEREAAKLKAETAMPVNLQEVLIKLEQGMFSYAQKLDNKGNQNADREAQALDHFLRESVERNFDALMRVATDDTVPANQGIAIAALGFASTGNVARAMPVILQGAQLSDERLVDRAVFGLAMLQDPNTPPGVLMKIVEDPHHQMEGRVQAAWALYRLLGVGCHMLEIVAFYAHLLEQPLNTLPDGVIAMSLRGIGLSRDKKYAPLVIQHATSPVPWVRMMVAVALARMNAQDQVEVLLAMLSPAEVNANVRLYARTALRDLAGGTDRGYDVVEWRKVFDRSNDIK